MIKEGGGDINELYFHNHNLCYPQLFLNINNLALHTQLYTPIGRQQNVLLLYLFIIKLLIYDNFSDVNFF